MSRPLRIDYPNAWHHVMNRARRGANLFVDKADYQQFIDLLQETADLFNVNVAAYCLMPSHYHLMVHSPDANLSRCMRHLNGVYTQRYNVVHGCDGTLFRGRYKSILVDAEIYVLQLVRYIHLNPVRARIVDHCKDYQWSSYPVFGGYVKAPGWLETHWLLSLFGKGQGKAKRRYRDFVESVQNEELDIQSH